MYKRIGHLKTVEAFRNYLDEIGATVPCDAATISAADGSPLAEPLDVAGFTVGNRWAIHPMEGWDATTEGLPTQHTLRRWQRFGHSGAKLIWGGEAFSVVPEGRANPNQLFLSNQSEPALNQLLTTLRAAHKQRFGTGACNDLLVGLQLTHSGRFSRPNRKDTLEPRIAYHHPVLDKKFNIAPDNDAPLLTDSEIEALIEKYIEAAQLAQQVGFNFVDVKHCHGYLGHEFLSAYNRPGPFGGNFHGRTNFLRQIVRGIQQTCPGLLIGVRLSLFDFPPFHPDPTQSTPGKLGPGIPDPHPNTNYPAFGCDRSNPLIADLTEPIQLLKLMRDELGIAIVNLSAGSPYYNPHIQRPAYFPPSDGYQPPEDPLIGCARQLNAVREVKSHVPNLPIVGTALSYFQDYTTHIAQAAVRENWMDFAGLGRMVLSYPDLPADSLEGNPLKTKLICRTFSDCTTAPRNGIISGCYPLDDYYKSRTEHDQLKAAKKAMRERLM